VFDGFIDHHISITHAHFYTTGDKSGQSRSGKLLQQKSGDGTNQSQVDRYDTRIIKRTHPAGFLFGDLPVLMDILDDVKPQQKEVDLDSQLGDLIHDHDRKNNE
jgi:hypothetical protein